MKRINVSPDLLSAMSAAALFAGSPRQRLAEPVDPKRGSIFSLGRWFKPAPAARAATKGSPAPSLTLDDDWVGGWYARTRLLQAATLAHWPEDQAETQIQDFS